MRKDLPDGTKVLAFFEGFMQNHYERHGFGRLVEPNGDQRVGWWKHGEEYGNFKELEYEDIKAGKLDNWKGYWYDEGRMIREKLHLD